VQIAEFDARMLRERSELEAQRCRVATLQSVVVDKERLEAQVAQAASVCGLKQQ
jgi:hypothetical protein